MSLGSRPSIRKFRSQLLTSGQSAHRGARETGFPVTCPRLSLWIGEIYRNETFQEQIGWAAWDRATGLDGWTASNPTSVAMRLRLTWGTGREVLRCSVCLVSWQREWWRRR